VVDTANQPSKQFISTHVKNLQPTASCHVSLKDYKRQPTFEMSCLLIEISSNNNFINDCKMITGDCGDNDGTGSPTKQFVP